MMNPRYFIGVTLPNKLSHQISIIQRELYIPHKTMEPLVPHITLLDPNTLLELSPVYFLPKVRKVATEVLPIKVNITEVALFGKKTGYINIEGEHIVSLRKKLVELLPDHIKAKHTVGKDFIPHITIIQAKPNQKLDSPLIENFKKQITPLLPQEFTVNNLNNFQWIRKRTYEVKLI